MLSMFLSLPVGFKVVWRHTRWLWLAALLLLIASPARAADRPPFAPPSPMRFEHLSLEDGLSQNSVLAMLQDHRGFLWFGTQDGLNRYDGYTFTVFKNDPDDPNSLSLNSILALHEDDDGALWIGTWGGGLNRFDPSNNVWTRFRRNDGPGQGSLPLDPSLRIEAATVIDGTLLLAGEAAVTPG